MNPYHATADLLFVLPDVVDKRSEILDFVMES